MSCLPTTTPYGCMTPCGAAFPWTCGSDKCPEVVIHINLNTCLRPPNVISTTDQEAKRLFAILKSQVAEITHFPTNESRFGQLIYLAGLSDEQNPYSESDLDVMERCHRSDVSTKRWLNAAFIPALGAPIAVWGLVSDDPWMVTASLVIGVAAGVISWIATGSNPDFKSDAANDRQNALYKSSKSLEQIAAELIDLNSSDPYLAQKIAASLKLPAIADKMALFDPKAQGAPLNLDALEGARRHVLGKPLLDRTPLAIRHHIQLSTQKIPRQHMPSIPEDLEMVREGAES